MTLVKGRFLKLDGSPLEGVTVQASLASIAAESNGPEIYVSNTPVTATSDSNGDWSLNLWANSNGVEPSKYTFVVRYTPTGNAIKYEFAVPNDTEVYFSDLMADYSQTSRSNAVLNMEASKYDFTITQGNSVHKRFDLVDVSNQSMNLSGWQAYMKIKSDIAIVYGDNLTVDSTNGSISLNLRPSLTKTFTDSYVYELVIYTDVDVVKVLYGTITVNPSFNLVSLNSEMV